MNPLDHIPLVHYCVRRLLRSHSRVRQLGKDDAEGAGMLGLCKACAKFDAARGGFGAFAFIEITRAILAASRHAGAVSTPRKMPRGKQAQERAIVAAGEVERFGGRDFEDDWLAVDDPPNPVEGGEVLRLLATLPARERAIIVATVIEGKTLEEMGARFHFSKSRAQQIRARGIARLRERLS